MAKEIFKPEDIINKLREAEMLSSQRKTVAEICRALGITDQTYYQWRKEYGGMGTEQARQHPERGRFWLTDGSCIRLRAEYPGHVWSYDFVADRTYDGRAFRTLNIIDEYIRECLAIRVGRSLTSEDGQACLTDLFCTRGVPVHQCGPRYARDRRSSALPMSPAKRGWAGALR